MEIKVWKYETMINPQSPIPIYRQLADQLTAKIRTGEYRPGERIPSEHRLAADLGIGRPTARQAVDLLVRKGLLHRRRGSGTYVCEAQQEVDLFSLDGTTASFRKKGVAVEIRIITPIQLQVIDFEPDNPFNGRPAYFMTRLTMADCAPVLLEDLYLEADLFAGIDKLNLKGRSLSAVAEEQFYLRPVGGKQSFSIGYADHNRHEYLQIGAQTPVLMVRRRLHFPQKADGVYSQFWCRTDQFVFTQNIGGVQHA
jgi:GntR family transcriptional regulator